MKDTWGRDIDYMRISITDRCNLRCRYCMPQGIAPVPMEEILTYEEIEKVCEAAAELGIRRLKITGGEPLVRKGCTDLAGRLKRVHGIEQVTLTTNGVLLAPYAKELADQGLSGVNISLDTLDREVYAGITGTDALEDVKAGIKAALSEGLSVKINAVLQPEINDTQWEQLLLLTAEYPLDVRFIEMMPIGYGKEYRAVSNMELLKQLKERYPELEQDLKPHGNGPAVYYRIPGFQGSAGFISAVNKKFCRDCNRIRLTAAGELKPCLCYEESVDVRAVLRGTGETERKEALRSAIQKAVRQKPGQHCFDQKEVVTEKQPMVRIGG